MFDLIDRQALIKFADTADKKGQGNEKYVLDMDGLRYLAQRLPTVDAVEVVRCKDCKKNPQFERKGKHTVWCRQWRCEVKETDFCSYGERRDDNC